MSFFRKMKVGAVSAHRSQQAIVCGISGWVVSIALIHSGGALSRFIPESGTPMCAFLGATVSGYVVANGFGRSGRWGRGLAVLSAVAATILGAVIAGIILGGAQFGNAFDGAGLGVLAVADGFTSTGVFLTWVLSMYGVDWFARWGFSAPNLAD
jgi:hypothetical protein